MKELISNILSEVRDYEIENGSIQYDISGKLVEPTTEGYYTSNGDIFNLITVFREGVSGYTIAFDSENDEFCLCNKSEDGKLEYYGHYGSFMDTFLGM